MVKKRAAEKHQAETARRALLAEASYGEENPSLPDGTDANLLAILDQLDSDFEEEAFAIQEAGESFVSAAELLEKEPDESTVILPSHLRYLLVSSVVIYRASQLHPDSWV